jgi:hypothetical protein
LDQILYSLGVEDVDVGKSMILAAMRQNGGDMGKISYRAINSIQKIDESAATETRYNQLLGRVGATISIHPDLVKLVSYIILFSADFTNTRSRRHIEAVQDMLVNMVRRFIFAQYPRPMAVTVFGNVLTSLVSLRELTTIKRSRQLAPSGASAGSAATATLPASQSNV